MRVGQAAMLLFLTMALAAPIGCGEKKEPKADLSTATSAADYFNKAHDISTILPPAGRFKAGTAKDAGDGKVQFEDLAGKKFEAKATQEGKDYKFSDVKQVK